ncbi:MAG: hypothetical protein K0Q50_1057 [Vampirovibrio sp.]|jgi:hypothetical protein|nr:hypothetical protein [Vampirovibrio sp.]
MGLDELKDTKPNGRSNIYSKDNTTTQVEMLTYCYAREQCQ